MMSLNTEEKLIRAISHCGLSWIRYAHLCIITEKFHGIPIHTACWYYDKKKKKEGIVFNPFFIDRLTVEELALVVKHEVMHKVFYRNLNVESAALANLVLDVSIDKILYLSFPETTLSLHDKFLNASEEQLKDELLQLKNSAIKKDVYDKVLRPEIKELIDEIWMSNGKLPSDIGNQSKNNFVPDPYHLYMIIASTISKEEMKNLQNHYFEIEDDQDDIAKDGHIKIRGGNEKEQGENFKEIEADYKEVQEIKRQNKGNGCSEAASNLFEKYNVDPAVINSADLEQFINSWRCQKELDDIQNKIYDNLIEQSLIEPYPNNLSRTGFELVSMGISDLNEIPLFFNKDPECSYKKKVACYFDLSPSMEVFLPQIVSLFEFLDNLEEINIVGKYKFAGSVEGINDDEWEAFKRGQLTMGSSTFFEGVIKHAINQNIDVIAIFTDGESRLSTETVHQFNTQGKTSYNIYFSHHNENAESQLGSQLDNLNGASFTVKKKM